MNVPDLLMGPITQALLAQLVGISEARASQLAADGVLVEGATGLEWLQAYCGRLREQAAGRASDGPLDLAQERAALAREQRLGLEIKNATLRGDYAPIDWLGEVLAAASQAVAERFDHLPGQLRKACPDLPPAAIDRVMGAIASARNEWVRQTSALRVVNITSPEDDASDGQDLSDEPRTD